jgi:hypothetical protein
VLADPAAYARAAALPDGPADPSGDGGPVGAAARRRRDLAVAGFLELRSRVLAAGPGELAPLYRAAAALVCERAVGWRALWRDRALAEAQRTGEHLAALAAGDAEHLSQSAVYEAEQRPGARGFGMCGRLQTWRLTR